MSEHIPVFIYTFLACLSFCVIFKFHKIPHMQTETNDWSRI